MRDFVLKTRIRPQVNHFNIAGSVLAGGQGRRMGGVDKGLMELAGRPMVAWAIERLAPQVAQVMISANRSREQYLQYADVVVADEALEDDEAFAGPLSGFLASMRATEAPYLLTLPCDAPFTPPDLAQRLAAALRDTDADIAVAEAGGRLYPVHALMSTSLEASLAKALNAGERRVTNWCKNQQCVRVKFDDVAEAFINVNTPDDLAMLSKRLD